MTITVGGDIQLVDGTDDMKTNGNLDVGLNVSVEGDIQSRFGRLQARPS
jgi:hypothetical protein